LGASTGVEKGTRPGKNVVPASRKDFLRDIFVGAGSHRNCQPTFGEAHHFRRLFSSAPMTGNAIIKARDIF